MFTENEKVVLGLIRDSKDPEKALLLALEIFSAFLEQREEILWQQLVSQQESAGKAQ